MRWILALVFLAPIATAAQYERAPQRIYTVERDYGVACPPRVLNGPGMNTVTTIDKNALTMYSSWHSANGALHSATTPREDGEPLMLQASRHRDAVQALQAVFPPVPTGTLISAVRERWDWNWSEHSLLIFPTVTRLAA